MRKSAGVFVALGFSALASFAAFGDPIRTVEELVQELERTKGTQPTITLAKGTYDVSSVHMRHNNADKEGQTDLDPISHLAIDKQTLTGETGDPRDVVIYGDGSETVLYMWAGRLRNVTISNGCANASAPSRPSYAKMGGGVNARNVTSQMSNVVVTCCSAPSGGGIYNPNCIDVIVENCTATSDGGGLYALYSSKFTGGEVRNCTAGRNGGGVYGVWIVDGTKVHGNSAVNGGGFHYSTDVGNGSTVSNAEVYDNKATAGNGGGFYRCAVSDSVVSNNSATVFGGGLYLSGSTGCAVTRNSAPMGAGVAYGAVTNAVISYNVSSGVYSDNTRRGAGVYDAKVYGSRIAFNLIPNDSAAVALYGAGICSSTASNCVLTGNAVASGPLSDGAVGGGAYMSTLIDSQIDHNFAALGAAFQSSTARGCVISNNVASANWKRYTIRLVSAPGLFDCDIYNEQIDSPRAMVNCKVRGLTNEWTLAKGENVWTNGTFEAANGYLVFSSLVGGLAFTNCLFSGNYLSSSLFIAPTAGTDPVVPFVNCTVAGNQTPYTFINFDSKRRCEVVNSIFEGNVSSDGVTRRDFRYVIQGSDEVSNITLENCLVGTASRDYVEALEHPNTIISDAVKFDSENAADPYSIRHSSKARGNGKVMDWMTAATDVRRDPKYPRLRDGKVDIGCYQCWLDPIGSLLLVR